MLHLLHSSQQFTNAFVSGAVPFWYCSWEEHVLVYQCLSSNLPEFDAVLAPGSGTRCNEMVFCWYCHRLYVTSQLVAGEDVDTLLKGPSANFLEHPGYTGLSPVICTDEYAPPPLRWTLSKASISTAIYDGSHTTLVYSRRDLTKLK